MSRLILPLALIIAAAMPACVSGCRRAPPEPKVIINGHTFEVEIAETIQKQQRGLSGRPSLAPDRAMLFVFRASGDRSFYMKECYFPIDIAFLDADRKIINQMTMAVEPDPDNPVQWYNSDAPARYVLEATGGTWERIGAEPGMEVEFVDVFADD